MARMVSKGARLTSLALATGTLVVASGVGSAHALDIPSVFGGVANASAIHVEVNLPIALPIGNSGQSITSIIQDISAVTGNTALGGSSPVAVAKAVLGNGNVVLLSDLLNKVANSSLLSKLDDTAGILAPTDILGGLIHVGIGNVVSHVAPEATASTLTSSSSSRLAELKISLGNLLPTGGLSSGGVAQLGDVLNTVTDTVNGALNNALPTINNALGVLGASSTKSDAAATPGGLASLGAVTGLVSGLPNALSAATDLLGTSGNILTLGILDASNKITRAGAAVTSEAAAGVAGLDVLGGLVHLDAVKSSVKAVAGGVPGSASSSTDNTILGLSVKDLLNLKLDGNGLTGSLAGTALPSVAQGALDTVLSAVNGVLDVAGVKIQYGQKLTSHSPDGRSASASTQGVGIIVAPPVLTSLLGGKPLVSVQLVPAAAAVNAAIVPVVPKTPVTPKSPTTITTLAHTGAPLTILGGLGLIMVLGAMAARRRFTTSNNEF